MANIDKKEENRQLKKQLKQALRKIEKLQAENDSLKTSNKVLSTESKKKQLSFLFLAGNIKSAIDDITVLLREGKTGLHGSIRPYGSSRTSHALHLRQSTASFLKASPRKDDRPLRWERRCRYCHE